jgi:hypothetical protein
MAFPSYRWLACVALLLVGTGCPPGAPPASPDAGCSGESCSTTDLGGGADGSGGGGGDDLGSPTTCDGVSCNTPPARVCADAQTLRIYDATGSCSDGKCSYSSRTESCAGGCANGACVNNPCQGVTCNLPPANRCLDASTLVVPSPTGSCSGGSCRYAESFQTCPFGCANDACVGDPCAGKTCNQPPAKFCLSPSTLRTFQTAGVCTGGSCLYAPTDETCAFGCANGACANDPCAGKTCNQPPAAACVTANTLRTFSMAGMCSGGSCLYTPSDVICTYGCAAGACANDPCAGVSCNTPPATSCLNPTTLRKFVSPGSCAGGACSYQPQDSTCPFGCASGACNNDPCQGVSCTTPPAGACVNPTTLRTFSSSGMCNGGACSYAPSDFNCQYGCSAGACLNDPCQGVTCNAPPAKTCVAGAARLYSPSGTCASGTCSYSHTDTPCDNGCANGVCNPPACGGVTCNTPPATTCTTANRLHTYFPIGSCASATCSYAAYDIDCSQGCINGACIAGSWTLESTPYSSSLDNGNGVLDSDGEPVLVGCVSGTVRVRRRTSQGWKEETVDSGMGSCEARVALDATGEPLVAYTDAVNQDLRFAMRNGGSWSPKELVANSGDVGRGLSLAITAAGIPQVSYNAPSEVRLATRTNGIWTEETIPSVTGYQTELRLQNGSPVVFVASTPNSFVAQRSGGSWSAITTSVGNSSIEVLRPSFVATGGVPRILLKGTNPLNGQNQWTWRTVDGNGLAMREEIVYGDTPQAMRTDGPLAVWARRLNPSTGYTLPVIRAQRNGAWGELVNPVPWGSNFGTPVMYTGGSTRHVLVDTYARRLLSPTGCTPDCSGRACGDDGCGGVCGACGAGLSCAPTGICSTLAQSTMQGFTPSRTALGSGTVVHAVETSYSAYVPEQYRASANASWTLPVALTQASVALGVSRVTVDSTNTPRVILNGTIGAQTGAFVGTRDAGGTWTTELVSTVQGGSLAVDGTDTLYYMQCSTSTISLRTRAPGGAWTAATAIYTRPSGYDGMICGDLVVSSAGVVAIPVWRSYWVGSPVYADRYDRNVLTNEGGSYTLITQVTNQTSYGGAHELAFDGTGALHSITGLDYRVKPPMGAFATESLPAGMPATALRQLAIDKTGALYLAWTAGAGATQAINLSKRTAASMWTTDSAAVLSSVNTGMPSGAVDLFGVAFDGANRPFILISDGYTYRSIVKAP